MLYAAIDTASSGDSTVVAGVTGRKIRVVSYQLVTAGAVSVRWKSGASTSLSGAMPTLAGTPIVASPAPEGRGGQYGWLETNTGDNLVLNLSGAVQVSGHVGYMLVN